MMRDREDRLVAVIGLFVFLTIAMIGFYLVQFSIGSIPGWLMLVAGLLLFGKTSRLASQMYRHYPNKEKRLVALLIVSGVIIAFFASSVAMEVRITPLRMTITVLGIFLVLSGAYLFKRRNLNL